ncbi:hypothetical protein BaRGS_00022877 [Batillaria attramentaria]|uniref:Shugoshin C-terminal domain-containing protein n=1 Tax=Batillaria attramentaria TaxID=370345 RepID=A0ABD0KFR8_9CAEN
MDPDGQPTEKGTRRKLKRIVKKKTKVGRNASASVVYYKKVKAALNASLNSSRVRQTLQSNNKALAQSLQQVKQELRIALNDNARLRLEIQDLNIKLLRLENQGRASGEQSDLERRLHSLKTLLHHMSSHLLEVGTCINDGVDLCLLTPRTSQASTTRPPSIEQFTEDGPNSLSAAAADAPRVSGSSSDGFDCSELEEPMDTNVYPEHRAIGPVPLSLAAPDMSIILEQSIIVDEGQQAVHHPMDPVLEEPMTGTWNAKTSQKDTGKKPAVISKLPQRVRNIAGSSSGSEEEDPSDKKKSTLPAGKRKGSNGDSSGSSAVHDDQHVQGDAVKASSCAGRRGTFVVSKTSLVLTGEDAEGIDSIAMPDLVGGVSTSEEECSPKVCKTATENSAGADTSKSKRDSPKQIVDACDPPTQAVTRSKTESSSSKPSAKKKELVAKSTKATLAFKKPAAVLPPRNNKKDELFISNPCALNLVHLRNTGSSNGCIGSSGPEQKKTSSVDQFLASIKESNMRSRKIASLSPSSREAQKKQSEESSGSNVTSAGPADMGAQLDASGDVAFPDTGEETVYFNADMEFTEILPAAQSLETMEEEPDPKPESQDVEHPAEQPGLEKPSTDASAKGDAMKRSRSKPRSKAGRSKGAKSKDVETEESDTDSGQSLMGEGKKLAVAMRVGKPGDMKFAASRKEEDGSRKAIPVKPDTKARSKSKKRMEEMLKNLPTEEPKSIFDFHDKTPRHTEAKPKGPPSVFDISLDESCAGAVPSLATFREKLAVLTKGLQHDDPSQTASGASEKSAGVKPAPQSLLGNAPEYRLPLKGDDSDNQPEPKPQSRGRSASKGRNSQGRSKSRSRKTEEKGKQGDEDENEDPGTKRQRERSRSRARSKKSADDEELDADFQDPKPRGRSRSRRRPSLKDGDAEEQPAADVNPDTLRRSARSKSTARKTYVDEDSTESLGDMGSNTDETETEGTSREHASREVKERGRSRSRRKRGEDDDDEYVPSRAKSGATTKPEHRGRSKHKTGKLDAQENEVDNQTTHSASKGDAEHGGAEEQPEKSVGLDVNTGNPADLTASRSRSRKSRHKSQIEKTQDCSEDVGLTDSDTTASVDPCAKVTQRRHRSKSAHSHRRLYCESDTADDAFGFFSEPNTDTETVGGSGVVGSSDACTETRTSKRRTRSRGEALHQKDRTDNSVDTVCDPAIQKNGESSSSLPQDSGSEGTVEEPEVMRSSGVSSGKDTDRGSPRRQENVCVPENTAAVGDEGESEETGEKRRSARKRTSGIGSVSADNSPLPHKKGKASSPNSCDGGDKEKVAPSATSDKARRKKKSNKAGETETVSCESERETEIEKDQYQLQFEEVKRKLHQLDTDNLHKDVQHQPVKKSRPLVLPPSTATSVAKKPASSSKSLTSVSTKHHEVKSKSSAKSKKGSQSQPGSPHQTKGGSAVSSAISSSGPSSTRTSLQPSEEHTEESGQANGRRGRRAAACVSYKEPSLHSKLRRGDPGSVFLYKEQELDIYKSPKPHRKRSKSGRVDREVFTDLTNQSIAEVEVE